MAWKEPVASVHIKGLRQDGGLKQNSYLSSLKTVVAVVIRASETRPGWCNDELTAGFGWVSFSFSRYCFSSQRLQWGDVRWSGERRTVEQWRREKMKTKTISYLKNETFQFPIQLKEEEHQRKTDPVLSKPNCLESKKSKIDAHSNTYV